MLGFGGFAARMHNRADVVFFLEALDVDGV